MSSSARTIPDLRETAFRNRRLAQLGIEVMTLETIWRRASPQTMARPERVDFFMLLLVTRGQGPHMVEFTQCALEPGSLVFVQPGQVQQWAPRGAPAGPEGLVLLVD